MSKKNNSKQAKKLLEVLNKIGIDTKLENMVVNNQIKFRIDGIDYRIRKANYEEQLDIENFRRKTYLKFINDDSYLPKEQWIKKYKKKGIDIKKLERDRIQLQAEIEQKLLQLAKVSDDKVVKDFTREIDELKEKQMNIHIKISDLLSYSLEDQLLNAVNAYYCFKILEKLDKDKKWKRVFSTYKDFMQSDNDELMSQAFYYLNYLIYERSNQE